MGKVEEVALSEAMERKYYVSQKSWYNSLVERKENAKLLLSSLGGGKNYKASRGRAP